MATPKHANHDTGNGNGNSMPLKALVLVVEDEPSIARLIDRLLSRAGYATLSATTGDDALRLAAEARPDVITLDLILPGMSGEETLAALKRDARTRDIPVIIVSIRGDDIDCEALPVFAILRKPLDRDAMVRAIVGALRSRSANP